MSKKESEKAVRSLYSALRVACRNNGMILPLEENAKEVSAGESLTYKVEDIPTPIASFFASFKEADKKPLTVWAMSRNSQGLIQEKLDGDPSTYSPFCYILVDRNSNENGHVVIVCIRPYDDNIAYDFKIISGYLADQNALIEVYFWNGKGKIEDSNKIQYYSIIESKSIGTFGWTVINGRTIWRYPEHIEVLKEAFSDDPNRLESLNTTCVDYSVYKIICDSENKEQIQTLIKAPFELLKIPEFLKSDVEETYNWHKVGLILPYTVTEIKKSEKAKMFLKYGFEEIRKINPFELRKRYAFYLYDVYDKSLKRAYGSEYERTAKDAYKIVDGTDLILSRL